MQFQLNRRMLRVSVLAVVSTFAAYVILSAIHVTVSLGAVRRVSVNTNTQSKEAIPLTLKSIHETDSGQVEFVLSLDVDALADALHPAIPPVGNEATSHPLPQEVDVLLHDPDICKDDSLQMVFYIHTNPKNVDRRKMLRSTWGNKDLFKDGRTKIVFMTGVPADPKHQAIIQQEFDKYGDIVQGDFVEAYRNLTLKGTFALKWISTHCRQAAHVVKADDDAFINIFDLMKILSRNEDKKLALTCSRWGENAMPILRDPKKCMKWCVKRDEFPGRSRYPAYCAGLAYVMTRDLVPELYTASRKTPFFWIDDVYISGLLPPKVEGIEYVSLRGNFTLKEVKAYENYISNGEPLKYIFAHVKNPDYFRKMWASLILRLAPHEIDLLNDTAVMQVLTIPR